ncbi:MAG: hypothetical protein ACO3FB_04625 [Candidatus Nanopelagicaceae bacterium]
MARTVKGNSILRCYLHFSGAFFSIIFITFTGKSALPIAYAAGCAKTCVSVVREGGELVITARRDPIRRAAKVQSSPTPIPTPTLSKSATPSQRERSNTSVQKRTPRPSLSDQIRELLPPGSFTFWPRAGAVIYEPLLIHAQGCAPFRKTLPILDTSILLELTPTIEWNWGDGSTESWRGAAQRGAHFYRRAGRYSIVMRCHWSGAYRTPESGWAPIPTGITSSTAQSIELFRAQVFFTE